MPDHSIRLREPWTVLTNDSAHVLSQPPTRAVYARKFNRPSGLSQHQVVFLVIESRARPVTSLLNDHTLALVGVSEGSFQAQIDDQLKPFNQLKIEFEQESHFPPPALNSFAEVSLSIREATAEGLAIPFV